jgi:exonuclease III
MATEATIGLLNVRGVHPTTHKGNKLPLAMKWAQTTGCTLLALTETHTSLDANPFTTPSFTHHYQVAHASAPSKVSGVALISLRKDISLTTKLEALEGRLLVVEVAGPVFPTPLTLALVYAPDSSKGEACREKFWNRCTPLIPSNTDLLLGDFNVTLRPEDSSSLSKPKKSARACETLLAGKALVDVAHENAPHTFFGSRGALHYSARLDRAYAPLHSQWAPHLIPTADPQISDHHPIRVGLRVNLPPRPPVWRLRPENITPILRDMVEASIEELPDIPTVREWTAFKNRIKTMARSQQPLQKGKTDVQLSPEALRQKLEQDAVLARVPIDVARELPGPLLSAWVKGHRAKALITQLGTGNAPPSSDQKEIMGLLEEYWGSLFTYRPVSSSNMARALSQCRWPSLSKTITLEEVTKALAKPKPGSSPGPDGLPYEFYRAFPSLLPKLTALLNHCYQDAQIPLSWKQALLHPLPKEGKDPTVVSNYRPIALMCTDYKLLASVLADRLQAEAFKKEYFPAHQTGFVRGRSIYEPIIRVSSWACNNKGSVCLLDFEKAYDRVQHQWLFDCLRAAGIPQIFISFLQAAFQGACIQVVANGKLSRKLKVTSGVRQGDPLSPILFNFAIEPLLLSLEKGKVKVQGHADDTALGIDTQEQAAYASITLTNYEKASGMLLNRSKSVVLAEASSWITKALGFKAAPTGDRYLGLHIAPNGVISLLPATWEAAKGRLHTMARIPTSLFGKMTLLRAYVRSALLFQLVLARFEEIQEWQDLENRFLNSKDTKLSDSTRFIVASARIHILNWGRLPPITWEIDRRRLGFLASRGQHLEGKWSWLSVFPAEVTEGSSFLYTPFDALRVSLSRQAKALGVEEQKTRWTTRLLIPATSPLQAEDKQGTLAQLTEFALQKPLILTPTQQKWALQFNTDWPALWTMVNEMTKRVRSPIAAFIWRLLNVCLSWASHEECPLCRSPKASPTHLFLDCPGTTDLYSPRPLEVLLTPGQATKEGILALWSQWKLITWAKHNSPDLAKLNRHRLAHKFLDEEIQRAKNTGWM